MAEEEASSKRYVNPSQCSDKDRNETLLGI